MSKLMKSAALSALLVLALTLAGTASAHQKGWYATPTKHGVECTHHQYEGSAPYAFPSKEACQAALDPTSGQVCEDGETLNVEYPNLYVLLYGGTVGACETNDGGTAAVVKHASGNQLCYSIGGTPYTANDKTTALALEALGYWLPTAEPGNVDGGTNVGAYHLVCDTPASAPNLTGNVPPAAWYVDENGALLDPASASSTDFVGVYPLGV